MNHQTKGYDQYGAVRGFSGHYYVFSRSEKKQQIADLKGEYMPIYCGPYPAVPTFDGAWGPGGITRPSEMGSNVRVVCGRLVMVFSTCGVSKDRQESGDNTPRPMLLLRTRANAEAVSVPGVSAVVIGSDGPFVYWPPAEYWSQWNGLVTKIHHEHAVEGKRDFIVTPLVDFLLEFCPSVVRAMVEDGAEGRL